MMRITYPELLLPLWGHEALLGLLGLGGFLHALAHLSTLALNLGLLRLLRLDSSDKSQWLGGGSTKQISM